MSELYYTESSINNMKKETTSLSSKKSKTKSKIIESAIRCFARKGVAQTKLIDIAEDAKINHSLILYHFKSLDEVCYSVIESILNEFLEALRKFESKTIVNHTAHLRSYVQSYFILAKKSPARFSIWLHFYYKASHDERYKKLLRIIREYSLDKIRTLLLHYMDESGVTLPPQDLQDASTFVLSIINGNIILALTESEFPMEEYGRQTLRIVERYLQGIKNNNHSESISP
ncbi:MAG: TetR/AcrR family transcriptional regulator [Halobacteriovoraceae bacterium]|nr:TetR/AcrR family transcriptional regulator [Halobacteriovoraceae bacterium]MCB9093679.1 TetR/AcrR family transcriptional regulator [Halobacteriovoraceae bacterium]